jgi:hypothetical protein
LSAKAWFRQLPSLLSKVLYGSGMQGVFQSVGPIAGRTRSLAILAGCVAAITGAVSLSQLFPIVSSPLIFGAIAQPRFPRSGFWLMLVGALVLSVYMLPFGTVVLLDSFKTLRSHHDFNIVAVTLGWVSSFLLLVWCDAALLIESHNLRLL